MLAGDIVETAADAEALAKPPLLVLDRVRAFLDEHGLGAGDVRATRIGEGGGSNFTFLLEREDGSFVLRRPPRPPLPPSAHDVVREARLQLALREAGFERLPTIVAVCEDESLLGVPFYVMDVLDGLVPTDDVPPGLEDESARRALGHDLVDALVEIHAADVATPALAAFSPARELQRAPGSALRAAVGDQQDARDSARRGGRQLARRERARAAHADRRPR